MELPEGLKRAKEPAIALAEWRAQEPSDPQAHWVVEFSRVSPQRDHTFIDPRLHQSFLRANFWVMGI